MGKRHIGIRGFSLAEMMVVIVIFGILVAMSIPGINRFIRSNRLMGAMNELMVDMNYTRALATSQRRTIQMTFTTDQYAIIEVATGDTVRTRSMPPGIECAASADPNFYAWGLADPVSVTIDGGSATKTVNLSANGSVSHY
jgi:prepilin-type N-terminal cleavage/methylation domain-containing protein